MRSEGFVTPKARELFVGAPEIGALLRAMGI
jgi:hypothetical protein